MLRAVLQAGLIAFAAGAAVAHPPAGQGRAHYLANEAVMVVAGETKILFDPLFDETFGTYQQVPPAMREAMIAGRAPYDGVDAVFISHAHADHFAAGDVAAYLARHQEVELFAPAQAVDMMRAVEDADPEIFARITAIDLERGDPAEVYVSGPMIVEAVRIPHAGWPQRAGVQNLVLRVTVDEAVTVMHMGDADPDDFHFVPHADHFAARETGMAFPPYWFFSSRQGRTIVENRLNAREAVGVHVPVRLPQDLVQSGALYFHTPGSERAIPATGDGDHDH